MELGSRSLRPSNWFPTEKRWLTHDDRERAMNSYNAPDAC